MKDTLTIGILAHVDAGKTSLTECLLYHTGATQSLGSVDKGSAITDGLSIEKERGISIKSATVDFDWKGKSFNIVDTPGHLDFSAEVDRALNILDLVVLVVSAKEGIQAHTINIWESLVEREIPAVVFINKIDRAGADLEEVFNDFEKDLSTKLFALNLGDNQDPNAPEIITFEELENNLENPIFDKSLENLAEYDEDFLEDYLEGNVGDYTTIFNLAQNHIKQGNLTAAIFGSAKLKLGIDALLDQIALHKSPIGSNNDAPSASVFKVQHDSKLGRLVFIRSYAGMLKAKDLIYSQELNKQVKINQIFKYKLGQFVQTKELLAGEIGTINVNEQIQIGDVLGEDGRSSDYHNIAQSVLSVQVVATEEKDYQKLGEALEILDMEDPQLNFKWYKDEHEFFINILGPIQTEILKESLINRFGISAEFHKPKVVYKETPKQSAEGFVRYWMPKPCWAIMTFLIEPGEPGSGVQFESKVRTSDISVKYQNEVEKSLPRSLQQGIKGWEVTDIKITLISGEEHTVHSNPGDFLLATPMGIMRGLENSDTDLLEPMYRFDIKAHQDNLGPISSDLNQMNATINPPIFDGEHFTLSGRVSVEKAMDYSIQFNATTSGKGRLKLQLDGYEKTDITEEKTRPYRGVCPLDESQWILHMRGAFKAEER
jgi:ribosomal protection tetracycline resistance protein